VIKLKISDKKIEKSDIEKIKKYLLGLGFICNSFPSAQQLIYTKNREIIIIKNHNK